jgi:hypothetical protein
MAVSLANHNSLSADIIAVGGQQSQCMILITGIDGIGRKRMLNINNEKEDK